MTKAKEPKKYFGYSGKYWLVSIGIVIIGRYVIWPLFSGGPSIDYEVLKSDASRPYKATFNVVVELPDGELPPKEELGKISKRLAKKVSGVEVIYVFFFLPDMELDFGHFATAHHKPEMEVEIWKSSLDPYPQYHRFIPEREGEWIEDFVIEGKTAKFSR